MRNKVAKAIRKKIYNDPKILNRLSKEDLHYKMNRGTGQIYSDMLRRIYQEAKERWNEYKRHKRQTSRRR